jgi:hypothetical protein
MEESKDTATHFHNMEVFMYVKSREHLESENLEEVDSGDWLK